MNWLIQDIFLSNEQHKNYSKKKHVKWVELFENWPKGFLNT